MTLAENKALLVKAHRDKDWRKAKVLSQQRQRLKKHRFCLDCGTRLAGKAIRCHMHSNIYRFYNMSLNQPA